VGEGWRLGFYVKGDGKTEQQNKKNTMKTKNQNIEAGLGNPEQLNKTAEAPSAQTQTGGQSGTDRKDNRLPKASTAKADSSPLIQRINV